MQIGAAAGQPWDPPLFVYVCCALCVTVLEALCWQEFLQYLTFLDNQIIHESMTILEGQEILVLKH